MSLKTNVFANYFAQGWRALLEIAFVPIYIKYLGVETYGLIGIFAILQAGLSLLDLGMKPALGREMARFTAGAHSEQSICDLLRSIELIAVGIAALIVLASVICSEWLASNWLNTKNLPIEVMTRAFVLMGVIIAFRFIEEIYISSIAGLQRQVIAALASSAMTALRALGAVAVLRYGSSTVEAFFVWQGVASFVSIVTFASIVYVSLKASPRLGRFSPSAISGIWRFASGMTVITLLSLAVTQIDKVMLSRLLPLEAFSYYSLAGILASSLYLAVTPITTAYYPRFVALLTCNDEASLRKEYHQSAQLVSVLTGSIAAVLVAFPDRIVLLWTSDPLVTEHVAPLLRILVLGTLLNGLLWVPYHVQLAHGWTAQGIKVNIIGIVFLFPIIFWTVPSYGAIAAAWAWLTLNAGYVLIGMHVMHSRLLPAEKWPWYLQDVAMPLTVATLAAWFCRWILPTEISKTTEVVMLLISALFALLVSALSAPSVRCYLAKYKLDETTAPSTRSQDTRRTQRSRDVS